MHENKFEKQVREKMDQLGFDPADAIWTRVDQEINKGKRKRRPLFWIFFFSGLILGATGVYTVMQIKSQDKTTTTPSGGSMDYNHKSDLTDNQKSESHGRLSRKNLPEPATIVSSVSHGKNSARELVINRKTTLGIVEMNREAGAGSGNNVEMSNDKEVEKSEEDEKSSIKDGHENISAGGVAALNADSKEQNKDKTISADSLSAIKSNVSPKQKLKTSPWSFSLTATVGISSNNQSLFQSMNAANYSYYVNTPANSSTGSPSPAPYLPSALEPGFSFGAGFMVNRKLSKRVSLSAGLDYHYYSTKIHTGSALDSSRFVYAASGQATLVNSFYQGGESQTYINQYHFIGLPLMLSLQLNKSDKNPVNWEAGISFSWMLATNALHFDPNANLYFKNSQLFNKTQWNAATAVTIGFPVNKHTFELGPQIQYGLSGMLNTNTENPGHLFYLGMKMSFTP